MNILMLGDIVGKPGRKIVRRYLSDVVAQHDIELVVANGENAAGGKGITRKIADELYSIGVHIITTGNHVWQDKDIYDHLNERNSFILRPANYPAHVPGKGWLVVQMESGLEVLILNISGRVNLGYYDCPFRTVDQLIEQHSSIPIKIIDFHGETTSEKIAFGWYVDGRVSVVVGTHTHVQTSDYRILPQGTGYLTDVGMCGSWDSVIGVQKEQSIQHFVDQMPVRFTVANQNCIFCGVWFSINEATGATTSIQPIWLPEKTV